MLAAALCAIGGAQLTRPFVTTVQNVAVTFLICVDNDIQTLFSGAGWFCDRMSDILSEKCCSDI